MKSKSLKVSSKIYQAEIVKAFQSNAGETDPDQNAVAEVQKAAIQFVQRLIERAAQRSLEKDKSTKIYLDDILYQFRDNPKYLDMCAKKILTFSHNQKFKKNKHHTEQDQKDDQDENSQEIIEMYEDLSKSQQL